MLTAAMIKELKEIEAANGGQVPVDAIVETARDPSSALHVHPAFKWDLQQAAMEQWRSAAREVIRVFVTIVDVGDGQREQARAYVSIVNDDGARVYQPTVRVLRENRGRMIEGILDRLAAQLTSYPLPEFDPIVQAIAEVRAGLKTKPRGRPRGKSSARGAQQRSV